MAEKNRGQSFIICVAGLGVTIGTLAPVVHVPNIILLGVGIGMMLGGIFRELNHIQHKLKDTTASS